MIRYCYHFHPFLCGNFTTSDCASPLEIGSSIDHPSILLTSVTGIISETEIVTKSLSAYAPVGATRSHRSLQSRISFLADGPERLRTGRRRSATAKQPSRRNATGTPLFSPHGWQMQFLCSVLIIFSSGLRCARKITRSPSSLHTTKPLAMLSVGTHSLDRRYIYFVPQFSSNKCFFHLILLEAISLSV